MTSHFKTIAAVFTCSSAVTAFAQPTTSLMALDELTLQLPETRRQIERALKETGLSEDSVLCTATLQFDAPFGPLAGKLVGPYTCNFGHQYKKLIMESKAWVVVNNQKMNPIENAASTIAAIGQSSPDNVFMYEVLIKSRWVRN